MQLDIGIIVVQIIFGFFTFGFLRKYFSDYFDARDRRDGSAPYTAHNRSAAFWWSFVLVALTTGLPIYLVRWLISLL